MPGPPADRHGNGRAWIAGVAALILIAAGLSVAVVRSDNGSGASASPSPTVTTPAPSPSPAPPFALTTVPADGFPTGWWAITADDGAFAVVGPGPGELEPYHRVWQMDLHGSLDPRCFMYLIAVGSMPRARHATRADLLDWADRFVAHAAVVPIRSGSAVGWRTPITSRKGVPYGEIRVLYEDGWLFEIGYQMVNETRESARLGRRFLDSFRAPADVGSQP
jgi:hypothetical protein